MGRDAGLTRPTVSLSVRILAPWPDAPGGVIR